MTREYTFILERKIKGKWERIYYPIDSGSSGDNLYAVLIRSNTLDLLGYLNTTCQADWRWIKED